MFVKTHIVTVFYKHYLSRKQRKLIPPIEQWIKLLPIIFRLTHQ